MVPCKSTEKIVSIYQTGNVNIFVFISLNRKKFVTSNTVGTQKNKYLYITKNEKVLFLLN